MGWSPQRRSGSRGAATPWLLLLLAVSSILPYVGTLGHGFTWDDHTIIEKNPATSPETPLWSSLSSSYWPPPRGAGLYRPVAILAYRLQRSLWDLHPMGFHAVNILLHALSTFALLALLRRLWPRRESLTWTAAFLFALHPIHSEAVAGVVGSAELWAALWGFVAFALWVRNSENPTWGGLLATWGTWLLALGSKEIAAGWALLALAHRVGILRRIGGTRPMRHILDTGAGGVLVVFVLLRAEILGGLMGMSPPPTVDNPLVVLPVLERIVAASGLWLMGAGRLLIPTSFMPDASYAQTLPEATGTDVVGLLVLAAMVALILWRGRRGEPWIWGLAAALTTQFLTMNMAVIIGTCYAERLLYTPSFGYLVTLAALLHALVHRLRLPRRLPTWALAFAVLPAVALGAKTYTQAAVWKSDETLFRYAAKSAPRSVKAHTNLAVELWHKEDLEGAEGEVREALRWKPDYAPGLILSARLQHARGDTDTALQTIKAALQIDPRYSDGWMFLGALHLEREQWDDALDAYEKARLVNPRDPESLIGIASALAGLGQWESGARAWERAREANPGRADLLYPYGTALIRLGREGEAMALWREALARGHGDAGLRNDMAWYILQRQGQGKGDLDEAESLSREAVRLEETRNHTDTLLRILVARGKFGAADSLIQAAREKGTESEMIGEWFEVVEKARQRRREEDSTQP
jgi:tetratricopeptide (TPR) repeat protein